jgi:sugar lactone lactonase YvrE/thiol-disulfide isomerase/thioredoxin
VARVRAPELSGAGGWINTTFPLSLAALSGKVVVLHFWTYCCVNCLRVLDELRPLEQRFADVLVVVGVHSPKFPREHDHRAVESAVLRHRVGHPVLDDPDLSTWHQYGVRGWPTLVVIDPHGYVVGGVSGEGCAPLLTETIEGLIETHTADGSLVHGSLAALARAEDPPSSVRALSSPGKVAVEPPVAGRTAGRIAIADTGHDRVLVCDLWGRVEREHGLLTGPQGVRFDGDRLLVCDTGADRVVAIPLDGGPLEVLATGLASPWDLVVDHDGSVIVAEAGRHRLWRVSRDGTSTPLAGTGEENLIDGPAGQAILAQPSGLARARGGVVFVDAEASALRVWRDDGEVTTLVGQGLFDWGASDGGPDSSALQHPLGVAVDADNTVYVADTFNGFLRAWTGTTFAAAAGALRTLSIDGLQEPGGIDLLPDGRLLVADTGNHRVVVVDAVMGVVEPLIVDESWIGTRPGDPLTARAGEAVRLPYDVDPGGLSLDHSAGPPVHVDVEAMPATLLAAGPRRWELDRSEGVIEVVAGLSGQGTLVIDVAMSVCDDQQCSVVRTRTRRDLVVTPAEG